MITRLKSMVDQGGNYIALVLPACKSAKALMKGLEAAWFTSIQSGSVGGLVVKSIVAMRPRWAPGSIPGRRILFAFQLNIRCLFLFISDLFLLFALDGFVLVLARKHILGLDYQPFLRSKYILFLTMFCASRSCPNHLSSVSPVISVSRSKGKLLCPTRYRFFLLI